MKRLSTSILAASLLFGCADATGILVEVSSSDLSVPDDVDALRFEVRSTTGRMVDQTFPIAQTWPHSLTVLPSGSDDLDVTITVTGLKGGVPAVRRVVAAAFEPGTTRRVQVSLSRDCLGVTCAEGVDCLGGMCTGQPTLDGGVDSGMMDGGAFDAGADDSGMVDSGMVDSGPRDAGMLDSGPRDSGPRDSGPRDAGIDSGPPVDAGSVVRCDSAACAGLIVISEFATRSTASAGDEFVEIHNRSAFEVDVNGMELRYRSSSGVEGRRSTVVSSTIIQPGGFVLFGSTTYVGVVDVPDQWGTGFADGGGTVLITAGGAVIDLVGWGTAMPANSETAAFNPGSSPCTTSCERKARSTSTAATMQSGGADETAGNGQDSGDNSADFVQRSAPDPQTLSSTPELP